MVSRIMFTDVNVKELLTSITSNINQLEYDNTNWMEDAMVESYFNMYSGHFGKKLAQEAVDNNCDYLYLLSSQIQNFQYREHLKLLQQVFLQL